MLPTGIDRPAGSRRAPVLSRFASRLAGALSADVLLAVFPDPHPSVAAANAVAVNTRVTCLIDVYGRRYPPSRFPPPTLPIPDSRFPIPACRGIALFTRYSDIHVQALMTIAAAQTRLISLLLTAILLAVVLGVWESGTMIARM
jgi:hypothetical protein